jgi:hypothetical protein
MPRILTYAEQSAMVFASGIDLVNGALRNLIDRQTFAIGFEVSIISKDAWLATPFKWASHVFFSFNACFITSMLMSVGP